MSDPDILTSDGGGDRAEGLEVGFRRVPLGLAARAVVHEVGHEDRDHDGEKNRRDDNHAVPELRFAERGWGKRGAGLVELPGTAEEPETKN